MANRPVPISIGERYGRLAVIGPAGSTPAGLRRYDCACDCGARVLVAGSMLKRGNNRSCGCLRREEIGALRRSHGLSATPEYRAVVAAHARCTSTEHPHYHHYGGRGIEYRLPLNFGNAARLLIATIGQRPNARLTLDRIANDGHYEIGNLRWASRSQQNSNRRGPRAKVDLRMVELATID